MCKENTSIEGPGFEEKGRCFLDCGCWAGALLEICQGYVAERMLFEGPEMVTVVGLFKVDYFYDEPSSKT